MGNIRIILYFFFLPRILFLAHDEAILLEAESVKKKAGQIVLAGNVIAKTDEFVLTSKKLLVSDDESVYIAEDNVKINLNNRDVAMACAKCVYNAKERIISFFDVEIVFNNTTVLTTRYCDYNIDSCCLMYNTYGIIKNNANIISSKNGRIYVNRKEIFLSEDITCENEYLCLQCKYFIFGNKDKKAIFKDGITIKFKEMQDLTAMVKKQVVYDAESETFTTDNLILQSKKMHGYFTGATFCCKQSKINLYNGIIMNNNICLTCKDILYDMKKQEIVLKENPYTFLQNGIIFTSKDLHIKNF